MEKLNNLLNSIKQDIINQFDKSKNKDDFYLNIAYSDKQEFECYFGKSFILLCESYQIYNLSNKCLKEHLKQPEFIYNGCIEECTSKLIKEYINRLNFCFNQILLNYVEDNDKFLNICKMYRSCNLRGVLEKDTIDNMKLYYELYQVQTKMKNEI